MPTDDITIYYSVEPQTSEIARVASEQQDEIAAILQKPFLPLSSLTNGQRENEGSIIKLQVNFFLSFN
jgi:hypothetical protein